MIKCYFDGSCEPKNPGGIMGMGAIVEQDGKEIFVHSNKIPAEITNTNNIAEYLAFTEILNYLLRADLQNEDITIYGDSKLVIEQMFGTWKMKKGGKYIPYAINSKKLLKYFSNLKGQWIPREENTRCDDLSKI